MVADGRVSAWIAAWQLLEGTNQILDKGQWSASELVEIHTTRAGILTQLAAAPEDVGIGVGDWFQQEHIRKDKSKQETADFLDCFKTGDLNG